MKQRARVVISDLPYLPRDLRALGVDPEAYFKCGSNKRNSWAGWMLDRKKDAALIERLQSMHEPHETGSEGA